MKTNATCPGNQGRLLAASGASWKTFVHEQLAVHGTLEKKLVLKTQTLSQEAHNLVIAIISNRNVSKIRTQINFLKSHFSCHVHVYGRKENETGTRPRKKCYPRRLEELEDSGQGYMELLCCSCCPWASHVFFPGLSFFLCKHVKSSTLMT